MAGDSDDDRWTVRGVPEGYRIKAAEAAARGNLKVGAWLCAAIDLASRAEREPMILMPPQPVSDAPADTADAAADARLALLERAVAASIALANAPGVPTGFRRRANRLLRETLPAPAPRAQGSRRLLSVSAPRSCRVCGCTDDDCSSCVLRTGEPCHWVETDLCSACAVPGDG
jgi:hypothetical protein